MSTYTWNAYIQANEELDTDEPTVQIVKDGTVIDTIRVLTIAGRARVAAYLGFEEADVAIEDAYALFGLV